MDVTVEGVTPWDWIQNNVLWLKSSFHATEPAPTYFIYLEYKTSELFEYHLFEI